MQNHPHSRVVAGAVLLAVMVLAGDAPSQPAVAPPPRPKLEARPPLPAGAIARIGRPRLRFPGSVINVAFAPTGTTFVATSNPGPGSKNIERLVVLLDAATGEELRTFRGHRGGVEALAYSRDGKQLVTGGGDASVRLWDVANGQELRQFTGHTDRILAVAYSPNRKLIASTGLDISVRVWDADTAKELQRFPGCKSQGTSNLQFSPDGTRLAVVSPDFAIRLLNPNTGDEVATLFGPTLDSLSLDFSHDGKRLAAISADGKLWIWDVRTEKQLLQVQAHKGVGACVRFSPDGTLLATGGSDGLIRFWDSAGKLLRSAAGHPANNVSELSFSADGSILASAGHEGTVRLWDVATGFELPQSGGQVTHAALSPDGKRLATTGADPLVRFWEPTTGQELLPALRIDRPAGALAFSFDGRAIFTSNSVDEVRVWDIESGQEIRRSGLRTDAPVARLAVGSGGRYVAASGSGTSFRLWDAKTGDTAANWAPLAAGVGRASPVRALAFSRNDALLAMGCGNGRIHVWDLADGQELSARSGTGASTGPGANVLAWAPDGRTFASFGASDQALRLWEVVSGRERLAPLTNTSGAWSLAFSPDGRLLASGGNGGSFQLRDARTGTLRATLVAHQGAVTFLAFSPDGRFLVTAGTDLRIPMQKTPDTLLVGDGTALVWDVAALVREGPAVPKPAAPETEMLWETLAGDDPVKAGAAVWRFATVPDLALPLLKERLAKVAGHDPDKRVEKLLVELDDDDFDVREKATEALIRLGPSAVRAVRDALAATKSREVRRRAEEIIATVGMGPVISAEEILLARGIEILQRINTPESQKLLEAWADGPAGAPLTREARVALGLMKKAP